MVLNWSDISDLCNGVREQLRGEKFDCIVGVSRGGLIPATIIAYKMGVEEVLAARVQTYHDCPQYIIPEVKGKRVLVVDDINDSGNTFNILYSNGLNENATFCALYKKSTSSFEQGVYGVVSNSEKWIVFPWDK